MNFDAFITCAVTGSGQSHKKSDKVPVTPKQIAEACIEAAKEGAAVAHIHVRDPETGAPARDVALYKEVVDRVRSSDTDVILNLTAGMGGDLILGDVESPLPLGKGTDMAGATERVAHVEELLPEICTLDCGTMNFAEADYVMTNTPGMLRAMAARIRDCGVKPEVEVFDTGHLWLCKELVDEGLILNDPVLVQLCMGIPYGAPNDPNSLMAMVNNIPKDWVFSMFTIGRMQLPYVAQAVLTGGNVRVGLEDNIWLEKGVKASNGDLVARANTILSAMNVNVLTPAEVRAKLNLKKRG